MIKLQMGRDFSLFFTDTFSEACVWLPVCDTRRFSCICVIFSCKTFKNKELDLMLYIPNNQMLKRKKWKIISLQ